MKFNLHRRLFALSVAEHWGDFPRWSPSLFFRLKTRGPVPQTQKIIGEPAPAVD